MQRGWASELTLDAMIRWPTRDEMRFRHISVYPVAWSSKPEWIGDAHPWDHAKDFAIISKMMKRETC